MRYILILILLIFVFAGYFYQEEPVSKPYMEKINVMEKADKFVSQKTTKFEKSYTEKIILDKITPSQVEEVKDLAMQLKGKNDYETIWNIVAWEEKNIKYDWEKFNRWKKHDFITGNIEDEIQKPVDTWTSGYGVCIDYALLTSALLLSLGKECYIFDIDGVDGGHAFAAYKIGNIYFAMDQKLPVTDVYSDIILFSKTYWNLNPSSTKVYKIWMENGKVKVKEIPFSSIPHNYPPINSNIEIANDIIDYFSKKYGLKKDSRINNMEHMKYLPTGYKSGKYWIQEVNVNMYPQFGEKWGEWLDNRLDENFNKWRYVWAKVEDKKIYLYLAK
ncbi:transglutaminase-like domain-containing protein [Methanocaldococcus sp.]